MECGVIPAPSGTRSSSGSAPPPCSTVSLSVPPAAMASYPEVVTLTGLLITPRPQSALASVARRHQFLTELAHQLTLALPALGHDAREQLTGLILTATNAAIVVRERTSCGPAGSVIAGHPSDSARLGVSCGGAASSRTAADDRRSTERLAR